MTDFIDANQLKGAFTSISSTAEECAKAFKKAMETISNQPLVVYSEPPEVLVKESDYPLDATTVVSGTLSLSDIYSPALMALQCKSCGGAIDRDSMTCIHCGMGYILVNVNDNGINPRYSSF